VSIGVLVPIALLLIACAGIGAQVVPLSSPVAANSGATGSAGLVVVTGQVSVAPGEMISDVVVEFQQPDCPSCHRFAATTSVAGIYHLALPQGRYRAGCASSGIWAYCLPLAYSSDVVLNSPVNEVDFEIEVLSGSGDRDVRSRSPSETPTRLPQDLKPRIITPWVR
jgi:hypothetical protein